MIIDSLENASKYFSVHPLFEKAFAYITTVNMLFFNDAPDMFFGLTDGQFVIFFPEDVHAPMIGEDEIKKLVIKVKI